MECHGDHIPGRYINTGVPSVEEGHDVERMSVVRSDEDTMSTMVKLAKMLDQVEQKARSLVLSRPAGGWFLGAVDAFDSHEHGRSDLRKSRRLQRLPREACFDQAERDTVTLNEAQQEVFQRLACRASLPR